MPAWLRLGFALLATAAFAVGAPPPGSGTPNAKELSQGYRDGRVLAKPKQAMLATIDQAEQSEGLRLRARFSRFGHVGVLLLASGDTVPAAIRRLMATGRYEYVEPDYIRHVTGGPVVPNDAQFSNQWALSNTGANGGIAGADIHAEIGWETIDAAPNVVVGMLDSGALLTHQDLEANLWVNPSPGTTTSYASGSGSTAETDSLNGLNAVAMSGPPADDVGHGTHTSGIVGAVGNNGLGVAGVAWKVQLMELKFIASDGEGSTADEFPCIEYAIGHNVSVINASFGDQGFSQTEMNAIAAAGKAGIIFVCAAGNSAENIDISPFFPADYPLDNIICVGATDNRDLPVYFTNYGSGSVETFAPGENVISTYNTSNSSYQYESGTSMSAPFVTGTVALLRALHPGDTYRETINRVLNAADPNPALAGKAQTGGRLDLSLAVTAPNTAPNALFANRTNLVGLDPYTRSNNTDTPATPEAGTPTLIAGGGNSLWWQWTSEENAMVEIDTSGTGGGQYQGGSSYATALGVFTGSSLGTLTPVATNSGFGTEPAIGGAQIPYSEVTFPTTAGTTYQILVQGVGGATGQTILSINTTPDNDSVAAPEVLTGPSVSLMGANINASLEPNEPKILGNPGGHSLWYSWTAPSSQTYQVSGYSYDFTPEVGVYTGNAISNLVAITTAAGSAASGTSADISSCLCTFTATAGTAYLIKIDGVTSSDIGEFTLTIDDSVWQGITGDSVTCSPAVGSDGTVYVGSNDNSLYAFSPAGVLKWAHAGQGIFDTSSAAIAPNGTIYAGNTDGNIYALNADGSVQWTYAIAGAAGASDSGNAITSSPALASDGTIYAHGSDGNLYALNPSGTLKWTAPVSGASYSAPTIAPDGTIYIGDDTGTFYAFSPSGSQKWSYTTPVGGGEPIYTAAAIDAAGNIYFGTLTGNFYSLTSSGSLRWTYPVGDAVTSAPALANGAVYFGGYDSNLYSLSAASGALQWKFPMGSQVRASAPAVDANGTIYIGSYDHLMYAVSPAGSLVRTYASDDWIRSSPAISGTMLYFGSNDHKVYAFNTGVGPAASDWPMYQYNAFRPGRVASYPPTISSQPASQAVAVGSSFTLSVSAAGQGALSYQWYLNGAAIAGAVSSSYTVASAASSDGGIYTVTVTGSTGSVTSSSASVVVGTGASAAGRIVNLSARADVGTGGNILIAGFVIEGTGTKEVVLRGVGPTLGAAPFNVTGALAAPELTLINSATSQTVTMDTAWGGGAALSAAFSQVGAFALAPTSADSAVELALPAGSYTSQVSGIGATSGIALAEIYDADGALPVTSLVNISARANVGTGGNILIAGFVIEGSQPVTLLLRGVGPTLGTAPFNVAGVLAQPQIDLFNSSSVNIGSNAGWNNNAALSAAFSATGAFALPAGSADAAMLVTLPAGSYTLQLSGVSGSTGIGLVEVYLVP